MAAWWLWPAARQGRHRNGMARELELIRSAWVCALYGLPSLFAAYLIFLRRDVAGG